MPTEARERSGTVAVLDWGLIVTNTGPKLRSLLMPQTGHVALGTVWQPWQGHAFPPLSNVYGTCIKVAENQKPGVTRSYAKKRTVLQRHCNPIAVHILWVSSPTSRHMDH